jgi:hypothetical protein
MAMCLCAGLTGYRSASGCVLGVMFHLLELPIWQQRGLIGHTCIPQVLMACVWISKNGDLRDAFLHLI